MRDDSAYVGSASTASQRRPCSSATAPVVLLPANGSSTRSPGSVKNSTKNATSASGIQAGCGNTPRARHVRRYGLQLAVFGIGNTACASSGGGTSTLGGIAPPLSVRNDFCEI